MADDFIPLNQSTPVQGKWQNRNQSYRGHQQNNRFQNNQRRGGHNNRWGNNSQRNSSYGVSIIKALKITKMVILCCNNLCFSQNN